MNKKFLFIIVIGGIIGVGIGIIFYRTYVYKGHISIIQIHTSMSDTHALNTRQNIHFEIATTTVAQKHGLSGRATIPNNYAMLFVFPKPGMYGFWMKDMLAPIDIVWLSDNRTVVSIKDSVKPNTYPQIFYPPVAVKYVLEVRSGFSATRGWHVGSIITLPSPYDMNYLK